MLRRYAVILAGGSGTRLWPMSRAALPKQLIPFIRGKSLLQLANERMEGFVHASRRFVCAGELHRETILRALPDLPPERFLGEPVGRDTANAAGFTAAIIARQDPDAAIGVFTADHLIQPADRFQNIVARGYELVERYPDALVTFGITPTAAATGYGYLELGEAIEGDARAVVRFKEKPDAATACAYFAAGPSAYLWNSGMFVWRAATLLDCLRRYEPAIADGLARIAAAWDSPLQGETVASTYPQLRKVSVDYAVMEPASRDDAVRVLAVPMDLHWLDVGSWPSYANTCERDERGNARAARALLYNTSDTLVASSDPGHLIAAIGCDNLVIIHTPDATLVCPADQAESIKELHRLAGERFGKEYL